MEGEQLELFPELVKKWLEDYNYGEVMRMIWVGVHSNE